MAQDDGVSVGKAAGIGALLGLGLGRDLGDVIGGAAIGAAGGMIANEVIKRQEKKQSAEPQPQSSSQTPAAEQPKAKTQQEIDAEIEKAIGRDNYEGYKALRACEHERAYGLAKVAALSKKEDHKLVSLWLEAMTAVDQRDRKRAEPIFDQLVGADPDIDTTQQASLETDKAVLDLRAERRELGLSSCN
jgi:phage tail sheath protein FI